MVARGVFALAALLVAARRAASAAQPAEVRAVPLDAHTLDFGGRLYVALDELDDDEAARANARGVPRGAERRAGRRLGEVEHRLVPFTMQWFIYVACACTCVVCAAFAAGLTMGLVALDPTQLQITLHMDIADCATARERVNLLRDQRCAERVYPIIENHHLLLVTLLLVNASANEALPIFLDALLPSWAAILVSVTGVLIFGEIIPSAIFTGPNQLRIASALSPVVYALIAIASPIAYPLALALDRTLGDSHGNNQFKRQELRAIMKMATEEERRHGGRQGPLHTAERRNTGPFWGSASAQPPASAPHAHRPSLLVSQMPDGHQEVSAALSDDELCIINGVLDIRNKRAKDAMIPLSETYMLSVDDVLCPESMARILAKGHSRIPVYRGWPHNVCGILLVKKLIVLSPEDRRKISSLGLRYPLPISPDMPLLELLNLFQRGMSHLALVTDNPAIVAECMRTGANIPPNVHMAGIVTLEDILENIIAEGISDETDEGVAHVLTSAAKIRARIRKVKLLAESMRDLAQNRAVGDVAGVAGAAGAAAAGAAGVAGAAGAAGTAGTVGALERTARARPLRQAASSRGFADAHVRRSRDNAAAAAAAACGGAGGGSGASSVGSADGRLTVADGTHCKLRNRAAIIESLSRQGSFNAILGAYAATGDGTTDNSCAFNRSNFAEPAGAGRSCGGGGGGGGLRSTFEAIGSSMRTAHPQHQRRSHSPGRSGDGAGAGPAAATRPSSSSPQPRHASHAPVSPLQQPLLGADDTA